MTARFTCVQCATVAFVENVYYANWDITYKGGILKNKLGLSLLELLRIDTWKLRKYLESVAPHIHDTCWFIPSPSGSKGKVTLVSHIDTVWDGKRRKPRIFHDRECGAFWSPDGLGADDRAGVYSLFRIYNEMPDARKPNLLFCDAEESGCYGAMDSVDVFESLLKDSLFFIELDRKGYQDCVFYNEEPKEFTRYIETFGFKEDYGTFSDIKYIGEHFDLCAVNLSVGYYNEHQLSEYLISAIIERTIRKVKEIVDISTDAGTVWKNPNARNYSSQYWRGNQFRYGRWSATGGYIACECCGYANGYHATWCDDFGEASPPVDEISDPVPVDKFMDTGAVSTKLSRKQRRKLRRAKQAGVITDEEREKAKGDPFRYRND